MKLWKFDKNALQTLRNISRRFGNWEVKADLYKTTEVEKFSLMDRSIIVLMKSVKITFCVQKFKNFFWGGGGVVSRTSEFLPSRGRRLNILRKIKKRRLKLHFKCSAKIFLACHLKRITQAVISDKKFKFRFGTNAFWDTSCMTSCI